MAIDRDTPVNSAFIRVIDRDIISQSVPPTHHASIFSAQGTCVVKMAARIEAGASFSNWEKWNKTLKNFKSNHQVAYSVLCIKNVAAANRRLSSKVVCITHLITNALTLSMAAFIRASRGAEFRTSPKSTEIRAIQNRLLSHIH